MKTFTEKRKKKLEENIKKNREKLIRAVDNAFPDRKTNPQKYMRIIADAENRIDELVVAFVHQRSWAAYGINI